ncbi:hypothetical protein M316_0082 [Nitrincola phage 1M3-16]|uniref:hypothetical protein n=1 Tax=Nitrincola phage 1M3-16 TaxID=1472912 RepID=UPI000444D545|nr:hypothetical protein GJ22_gp070 [Nitrincola phage 1M3-16]AHX01147.1 hypothetical protein M316_0082 [Nitrincola phage 1M3-16]
MHTHIDDIIRLFLMHKPPTYPYTENDIRNVVDAFFAGKSSREIAKELFGSKSLKSSVNNIINSLGLRDMKEPSEDPKNAAGEVLPETWGNVRGVGENPSEGKIEALRGVYESSFVDNSRVLLISDMHIPYHHKDTLKFLQHLKDKYNPTRVICMGDELDKHALSYHDSDPDLDSAGKELEKSIPVIKELERMFPVMDILESNHGSLVWRKAKTHGIPRHYIRSYNDVLGVGRGWKWHFDLTIRLPGGNFCYLHHGKSSDVLKLSQQMGMCAIQGHYHEKLRQIIGGTLWDYFGAFKWDV